MSQPLESGLRSEFGLLVIGDEIISGKRADKHLGKVIELLAARGLKLSYAQYLGDDPERITETLKRAFSSGDFIFSTGGIGATPDDHTRQCAALALAQPLVLHPQAAELIHKRMQEVARARGIEYQPDSSDNISRLNMGKFPASAQIIPNPYNQIPGFTCVAPGPKPAPRGHPFRTRLSGHGLADDRMGARYPLPAPVPQISSYRKVGHHLPAPSKPP